MPSGAVEAAVAAIHSGFDTAAEIDSFKFRVERWLRLGPQHPAVCARFRARAAAPPQWQLDAAIREVERWWREERKAFALASVLGYGSRLPTETLRDRRGRVRARNRARGGVRLELRPALKPAAHYHRVTAGFDPADMD